MTAKERRKVKHTLKTSIDTADIWLKIANEFRTSMGVTIEELKNSNSKQAVLSGLEEAKKEISENYNKYMAEIENTISFLK